MPGYVILGATGGVGSVLCERLAASGAQLVLGGRDQQRLAQWAYKTGSHALTLDATVPAQVEACVHAAVERYGRLDGIVNCVGSMRLKPAHLTSDDGWATTHAANLTSAFAAVRAGVRAMMRNGGSIVLVSSAAARIGLPNHEAIAAAKSGVIGLTLAAAASYGPRGIRVNCVAPGLVRTPLTARLTANEASLKASEAMHVLGRIGEPAEVAAALAWLLDPAQGWVTGQVLGVDGGLGSVRARGTA